MAKLDLGMNDVTVEDTVQRDSVSSLLETNVYDAVIEYVYITESTNPEKKTKTANIVMNIDGKKKTFKEFITYATGFASRKVDGKTEVIQGYQKINGLAGVTTKKALCDLEIEDKTIMAFSWELGKEAPITVPVYTDLMGVKCKVGIKKINKHRSELQDNGKYAPTFDTYITNDIEKFYSEEGFTILELMKKVAEPTAIKAFLAHKGELMEEYVDPSKLVPSKKSNGNPASSAPATSVQPKKLF